MQKKLLTMSGVTKHYPGSPPITPVSHVDFDVYKQEFISIMGASGSGKSTLLGLMGAQLVPDSGNIVFEGIDLTAAPEKQLSKIRKQDIGFIFQTPLMFQALTVQENLQFTRTALGKTFSDNEMQDMLQRFQLHERLDHLPSQLSLGQRRRVGIVRALLCKPKLLLADEPTNDIDAELATIVMKAFQKIVHEDGASVVMVTHDARYAKYADKHFVFANKQVIRCE